jgi:hypothetical protein
MHRMWKGDVRKIHNVIPAWSSAPEKAFYRLSAHVYMDVLLSPASDMCQLCFRYKAFREEGQLLIIDCQNSYGDILMTIEPR